jgi:Tol biopolymer transport system component
VSAIFSLTAAGEPPFQLSGGPSDSSPAWFPDGSAIVFASRVPGLSAIVSVAPAGGQQLPLAQLTDETHWLDEPAISADGTRIAFVVVSDAAGGELWHMAADGSNPRPLFRHPGWDDGSPAFSPDGRRIAFSSGPTSSSSPVTVRRSLWLLDIESGVAGTIATDRDHDLAGPVWSPDGDELVYARRAPGAAQAALHAMRLGDAPRYLTTGEDPDWLRSGPAVTPSATPTAGTLPATATAGPDTSPTPPFPTFPPPPPSPPPFPTLEPPGPTSTGPAPTFPPPTATPTEPATASPSLTPTGRGRLWLPALHNRPPAEAPEVDPG